MSLVETVRKRFRENFGAEPACVARAPGRVEFIGNHTDYNQGPVIGAAIDRGVVVALRRIDEERFRFSSSHFPVVDLAESSMPQAGRTAWVNYPLGVYNVLKKQGLELSGGFEFSVESDLPTGSGLSSSAALELATAVVLGKAYGLSLTKAEMALVGRQAENEFVGVPCGVLDQGVSACGVADELVHIDCRNLVFTTLMLGSGYSIWVLNTHKKHSLVESMYSARYKECFEGVRQLNAEGMDIEFLADVSTKDLEKYGVALEETVAKRVEHVVKEIARVNQVKNIISDGGDISAIGKLLNESHRSSRDLFENSVPELDYLQEVLESMPQVVGARLTGGGFGGSVMALAGEGFSQSYADAVAAAYRGQFGTEPDVLHCRVSDGARLAP